MRTRPSFALTLSALLLVGCEATDGSLAPDETRPRAERSAFGPAGSNAHLGVLYELQAAFHAALHDQDEEAVQGLWAPDAVVWAGAIGCTPCTGPDDIADAFATSGPFVNGWASLAPAYKTRFEIDGNEARYQFECVYVPDAENMAGETVTAHLNATGTMVRHRGRWVFRTFQAGLGSL